MTNPAKKPNTMPTITPYLFGNLEKDPNIKTPRIGATNEACKLKLKTTKFPLIEHLIKQGTIHKVDYLTVEFHDKDFAGKPIGFQEKVGIY